MPTRTQRAKRTTTQEQPQKKQAGKSIIPVRPSKVWVTYTGTPAKMERVELHEDETVARLRAEERSDKKTKFVAAEIARSLLPIAKARKLKTEKHLPARFFHLDHSDMEDQDMTAIDLSTIDPDKITWVSFRKNRNGTGVSRPAFWQHHKSQAEAEQAVLNRTQHSREQGETWEYGFKPIIHDLRRYNPGGARPGAGAPKKAKTEKRTYRWSLWANKPMHELIEGYVPVYDDKFEAELQEQARLEKEQGIKRKSKKQKFSIANVLEDLATQGMNYEGRWEPQPEPADREDRKRFQEYALRVSAETNKIMEDRMKAQGYDSRQEFLQDLVYCGMVAVGHAPSRYVTA